MLHKLSQELIDKVFSYSTIRGSKCIVEAYELSLKHLEYKVIQLGVHSVSLHRCKVLNYYESVYGKVKAAYEDRTSVSKYLGKSFPNANRLCKYMVKHNVFISGSRALEYFSCGSIDENSDWDFFIYSGFTSITKFIRCTQTCGITWDLPIDQIDTFVKEFNSGEKHIYVSHELVSFLSKYTNLVIKDKEQAKSIQNVCTTLELKLKNEIVPTNVSETFYNTDKVKVCIYIKSTCCDLEIYTDIIRGTLTYKNKTTKVQLMLPSSVRPDWFHTVMEFDLSIIQCIVFPLYCIHMNADDAYSRHGVKWNKSHNIEAIAQRIEKYEKRGYTFSNHSNTIMQDAENIDKAYVLREVGDWRCETTISTILISEGYYRTWREYNKYVQFEVPLIDFQNLNKDKNYDEITLGRIWAFIWKINKSKYILKN